MTAYLQALRLERWPRSAAIFLGTAAFFFLHPDFASSFAVPEIIFRAVLSFLLTWAISTANYIINEIVDAPTDIHHPVKRDRPLVQGRIKKRAFIFLGLGLTAAALFPAAVFFSRSFLLSLLALLGAGFFYNVKPVRTKDIPFLDSISESANNPIRFLIGWYAFAPAHLFPPLSLLVAWWSFGNFLMTAKRLSEFRLLGDKAADYRLSHKRYSRNLLLFGMVVSAVVFLSSSLLFLASLRLYRFLIVLPIMLLYILLFFRKTLKEKEVMEEPESLLRNPLVALLTVVLVVVFALSFLL
ncbi:MAG: UbiA family prenyltransferase [Candidatus Aminicenantes bacterium]|nr:UbiA family prenyltransferase [Candidatus Aminicenantes bacterium]